MRWWLSGTINYNDFKGLCKESTLYNRTFELEWAHRPRDDEKYDHI